MEVDRQLVSRIANLAQIEISDEDVPLYEAKMRELLAFVEEIKAADVSQVSAEVPLPPGERDDVVTPSLPFELVALNAPAASGTAFEVPRIVER